MDRAVAYRDTRQRLLDLAREVGDDATPVPACPGWTVKDVYAHLVGINADALSGRMEGVAQDWWTQRQVDERADRSLDEVLAEWEEIGPTFLSVLAPDTTPPELILDAWTHEQDLRGALGRAGGSGAAATREHAVIMARGTASRITSHELAPVNVCLDGVSLSDERGDGALVVTSHEFLRGVFGRRSRRQLRAWQWEGIDDVDPYIDAMLQFGQAEQDIVETEPA
jgi:uncharacterized protein (TIGR03083 family)